MDHRNPRPTERPGCECIAIALLLVLCLWSTACRDSDDSNPPGPPPGRPPGYSSILITLDTTRADAISAYGVVPGVTPNIDRLAQESLRYDAARSVAPITMPAHASMLTGLYPPRHTVRNNNIEPLPRSAYTLAELARDNGLETAAFVSSVVLDAALGFDQGFDHYTSPPRSKPGEVLGENPASKTIDQVIDWLNGRDSEQRFFLWIHLFDPHTPYAAPADFASRFPEVPYLGEVSYMDNELGRLFDFLKSGGYLEDTALMLLGDHGEGLGQHGEKSHGIYLYDSTIRVPLIVRDPGGWGAGESTDAIVSVADVFPTLGEAMALPAQENLDGVSLFRHSPPQGRGVYFETYQAWSLHGYAPGVGWADAKSKYVHGAKPQLYVTTSDPWEKQNIAPMYSGELRRYQAAIAAVVAAPALARSDEPLDHSMLSQLQTLGYAASSTGDESFPNPLDTAGRPSSSRWVEENAALQRAKQAAKEGRFDEAIGIFQILLAGNPNNWLAISDYGLALLKAGRYQEALEQFQRYQEGGPPLSTSFMNAGICLSRLDRIDEAILQFEGAVKIDPNFTPAMRLLALIHRKAERMEESERWEERLRKTQPGGPG